MVSLIYNNLFKRFIAAFGALFLGLMASCQALATDYVVVTGQAGANRTVSSGNSVTWVFSVASSFDIVGARPELKRGNTTLPATLTLYEGAISEENRIVSVTVQPESVSSSSFEPVPFVFTDATSLEAGAVYYLQLTSSAGSKNGYSIKSPATFTIRSYDPADPTSDAGTLLSASSYSGSSANLSLYGSGPSPSLSFGSTSTYNYVISNGGLSDATTARLVANLPAGISYSSSTGSAAGWSCSAASQVVTCDYAGQIAASVGSTSLSLNVLTGASVASTVTTKAAIDPAGGTLVPDPQTCAADSEVCSLLSSNVDDAAVVSVTNTTDASEPSTNGVFTVNLSAASATDTVVGYSVAGTATSGTDCPSSDNLRQLTL
jgi:hypothetical protein